MSSKSLRNFFRYFTQYTDTQTNDGRLFHARAAATGKARSPIVLQRVAGTMIADDELEALNAVSTSYRHQPQS